MEHLEIILGMKVIIQIIITPTSIRFDVLVLIFSMDVKVYLETISIENELEVTWYVSHGPTNLSRACIVATFSPCRTIFKYVYLSRYKFI